MGERKLVYVSIVVAAIFDFMTQEDWESRSSNPYGSLRADVLWGSIVCHDKRTPKNVCGEATLTVALGRPMSSSLREFQHALSRAKAFARPTKMPAKQGIFL